MPRKQTKPTPDNLRWELRQRLILLEAKLIWADAMTTQDLRNVFGISRSQATKDIGLYQELAPRNLRYDLQGRCYRATGQFRPVFLHGTSKEFLAALRMLDDKADIPIVSLAAQTTAVAVIDVPEREFDVTTLQRINTAIRDHKRIQVSYQSMRNPQPRDLILSPHALVHTGFRWHVRAHSDAHGGFIDVLLSRMRGAPEVLDVPGVPQDEDYEWRNVVAVRIGAHPGLSGFQKEVIEADYGMQHGVLERSMRRALVPYYLYLMNVGAGDTERPAEKQQIVLLDKEALRREDRLG